MPEGIGASGGLIPVSGTEFDETPGLDVGGLLRGLLRRWKLILFFPLLALGLTYLLLQGIPPGYQASVQLLMFDPHQASTGVTGQLPMSSEEARHVRHQHRD